MSPAPLSFRSFQNDSPVSDPEATLLALATPFQSKEPPLGLYVAAVDALVHWQTHTNADACVPLDSVAVLGALHDFGHWYLGIYRQGALDAPAQNVINTAMTTLAAQCLSRPQVPVHQSWAPGQLLPHGTGFEIVSPASGIIGPVTYDIATLVRDAKLVWEEPFVLEVTIRYWERARKAGLPVGPDFGDFYRGMEWAAVLQHLTQLGHLARRAGTCDTPEDAMTEQADAPVLFQYIRATCSRYIELKPFLRLIERIEGVESAGGYAFGRM